MVMLIPLGVLALGSILAGLPFKEIFAGHGVEEFFRESLKFARATQCSRRCITCRCGSAAADRDDGDRLRHRLALLHPPPRHPGRLARQHERSTSSCSTSGTSTSSTTSSSCARRSGSAALLWKGGDGWLIDGFGPDGVSARVLDVTRNVVRLQTGYLYHYAFAMLIGAAALSPGSCSRGSAH